MENWLKSHIRYNMVIEYYLEIIDFTNMFKQEKVYKANMIGNMH